MGEDILRGGRKYYRVSSILQHFYGYTAAIPKKKLDRKKNIGQEVHEIIESYIRGELFLLNRRVKPFFTCFKNWVEGLGPKLLYPEKRFFDDALGITGKIDTLALFPDKKKPLLVDFKCVATEKTSWIYQAHFYRYLCLQNKCRIGDTMIFLSLDAKGHIPRAYLYAYSKRIWDECLYMAREYARIRTETGKI